MGKSKESQELGAGRGQQRKNSRGTSENKRWRTVETSKDGRGHDKGGLLLNGGVARWECAGRDRRKQRQWKQNKDMILVTFRCVFTFFWTKSDCSPVKSCLTFSNYVSSQAETGSSRLYIDTSFIHICFMMCNMYYNCSSVLQNHLSTGARSINKLYWCSGLHMAQATQRHLQNSMCVSTKALQL